MPGVESEMTIGGIDTLSHQMLKANINVMIDTEDSEGSKGSQFDGDPDLKRHTI